MAALEIDQARGGSAGSARCGPDSRRGARPLSRASTLPGRGLEKALAAWREALLIAPDDQRTRENVDRAERILSRLEEIQTRGP
jgi:hypothetical protein